MIRILYFNGRIFFFVKIGEKKLDLKNKTKVLEEYEIHEP